MKAKEYSLQQTTITKRDLVLDLSNGRTFVKGKDCGLTTKEFALLHLLILNENKEMSFQTLYEKVWDAPAGDDVRTVRVHMGNLRKKIDADNSNDYDIVSIYGKGYMFITN